MQPQPSIDRTPAQQVRGPAIGLICVAALNAFFGVIMLIGLFARPTSAPPGSPGSSVSAAEQAAMRPIMGVVVIILMGASVLIIVGAVKMRRMQSQGFATTAAILAMIPGTSCVLIAGIPIGIWALGVLRRPDVQAAFMAKQVGWPSPPGPFAG